MGLIELTTITLTIIGVSIVIVKAINKNTAQTMEMKEQFVSFKDYCEDKLSDLKENQDKLEGYIVNHDKRIWKLEDWKSNQMKGGNND